ncbi:MAG: hypothetical protein HY645_00120 [Acidobacteria bacterium]|nr:hypothetical protein [Acidobacteriota bacterium]
MKSRHARMILPGLLISLALGCRAVSTLKISGYNDTRGALTQTVTGSVAHPKAGTRLFGFYDLGAGKEGARYLEYQVSQPVYKKVGGVVEFNREYRSPRGTTRFGIIYPPSLPGFSGRDRWTIKLTPVSTNDFGAQFHFSGLKNFGQNTYVEGFFDYNMKPDRIVTEWQVGRRVSGNLFGIIEFRHSGFRREPRGIGVGLEWKFW